ncbi:MAG: DUF1573 domain-containing protein [Nitrospirae bacterium]|nr:DUF1573 domain-containing protein [Nitrospirota bacterium]MBI5695044.1 DUF1573 domain-containing protein [Nitrospirota bacterium]
MSTSRIAAAVAVGLFTALLFAAGPAYCGEAQAVAGPCIEALPAMFDFGEVDEGENPKATFTIRNMGDAELVIYDTKPSCGCTLSRLSASQLAPGETATIVAEYRSWNSSGKINKFIEVRSNDASRPLLYLDITGTVRPNPGLPGVPGT